MGLNFINKQNVMNDKFSMSELSTILALSSQRTDEGRKQLDLSMGKLLAINLVNNQQKKIEAAQVVHHLLQKASQDIREMLAQRLVLMDDVPVQLMLALAFDPSLTVAQPIIESADEFTTEDWLFIIEQTRSPHWQVIAKRDDLDDAVIEALARTLDPDTCIVVVNNTKIVLTKQAMQGLKKVAFRSQSLHGPMLNRSEIDLKVATELYWSASLDMRNQIIERYSLDKKAVDRVLEDILEELIGAAQGQHAITDDIKLMAQRYAERREITAQFMTKCLRRGQVAFFIALLAEFTQVPLAFAEKAIKAENSETLAILCKSKSIMKSDYASFYLMTREASKKTGEKANQSDLVGALSAYDRLTLDGAKAQLEILLKG